MASARGDLLSFIKNYDKSEVVIGLIGDAGAGKSSLINTIKAALETDVCTDIEEEFIEYVPTALVSMMGGHTQYREPVNLTDHIKIFDNRGWHDWKSEDALLELQAQIDGQSSGFDRVNWEKADRSHIQSRKIGRVILADKLTNIVFVMRATVGLDAIHGLERMNAICLRGTGRVPVVIITHSDQIENEDRKKITDDLQRRLNMGPNRIFFVRNIREQQPDMEEETKSSVLKMLKICAAESTSAMQRHDRKEKERKKMVEYVEQVEEEKMTQRGKERDENIEVMREDKEKEKLQLEKDKRKYEEIMHTQEKLAIIARKNLEEEQLRARLKQDEMLKKKEIELVEQEKAKKAREVEILEEKNAREIQILQEKKAKEIQILEAKAAREKKIEEKAAALEEDRKREEVNLLKVKATKEEEKAAIEAKILNERKTKELQIMEELKAAELKNMDERQRKERQLQEKLARMEEHKLEQDIEQAWVSATQASEKQAKEIEMLETQRRLKEVEIDVKRAEVSRQEMETEGEKARKEQVIKDAEEKRRRDSEYNSAQVAQMNAERRRTEHECKPWWQKIF